MCTEYIADYVINDDVRELLNSIAEKNGFKSFNLQVTDGMSKGDGFSGMGKNIKICNSNNPNQILNLYLKSATREKGMRELTNSEDIFRTEIYMYNTIFPHFKDFEICKGITPSNFMPSSFGTILNDTNEVIILENMKEIGYRLHDCSKPLDSQHIRLVITAYAKFHSLSFALRDQQPEVFEKFQTKLFTLFPKLIDGFKDAVINKCTDVLKFLNEADSKRLESFLQNIDDEFEKYGTPPIDKYSVVVHGDCWMNNILFQYSENSCDPTDVCIIDYQISRIAPPAMDLAYFFFTCSTEQDIHRCKEYLELYYKTLSAHLQKLGCDPNDLYPYSVFMKQWSTFAKFSLVMSPLALSVMTRGENKGIDLEESVKTGLTLGEAFFRDTNHNEDYYKRFKTIISYLVKNDLV